MTAVADLQSAVASESVLVKSVIEYLHGLPALLAAAQNADDAALAAIQAQVAQDTADLKVAASAAPAEPAPAPVAVAAAPVEAAPAAAPTSSLDPAPQPLA